MTRRRALLASLAAPALLPFAARAQTRDLTVVSWGGAYQDAQREAYFRPWMQAGDRRMLEETWDGGIGVLRARMAAGDNTWDVVQVEGEELLLGCAEGLFEPVDIGALGGADAYIPEAVHRCGVGAIIYAFVLAWDRSRLGVAPGGWADFFDTQRIPGGRALRRGPKVTLEIALLGDGVPAAAIYATLATPAGVDRAFAKLESIREALRWWERGSEPARWLASGEVALACAYNGRIAAANAGGPDLGIVWSQSLYTLDYWVIMRGSPNKARAMDFLRFVGRADRQAELPPLIPYGVTAQGANARLTRQVLDQLPTAPQNAEGRLRISDRFWLDNIDRLTARFDSWLGG
ncbi:MAG TPA: ABC transporter substrate-binding protein [Falsiroseomonas sp.]|jgi:putative spermidine/putrescine transport system substrate-binding protein|nr:ABC transporter substrate-binding protein [Falsiroseomonas sp.]